MLKGKDKGFTTKMPRRKSPWGTQRARSFTKTTEGSAEQYMTLTWCPLGDPGDLVVRTFFVD